MAKKYSDYQPLYKLILLYIFTFGLYTFYWFYRTWKFLKEKNFNVNELNQDEPEKKLTGEISPIWRTIGMIIPFYNLYLMYKLFDWSTTYADIKKIKNDLHGYGLLFTAIGLGILSSFLPFLFFLGVVPFAQTQNLLNKVIVKHDKKPIKKSPYVVEWLILILGGIWILLAIVGLLMPEDFVQDVSIPEYIETQCNDYCYDINGATQYMLEYSYGIESFVCYCTDDYSNVIEQTSYPYSLS